MHNIAQKTLNPTPKIDYLLLNKAYADTGCTETFLTPNSPCTDKMVNKNQLRNTQPNRQPLYTT